MANITGEENKMEKKMKRNEIYHLRCAARRYEYRIGIGFSFFDVYSTVYSIASLKSLKCLGIGIKNV